MRLVQTSAAQEKLIGSILRKIVPAGVLFEDEVDLTAWMHSSLPLVAGREAGDHFAVYMLCRLPKVLPVAHFFQDMIRRGLVPDRLLNIIFFHQIPFLEDFLFAEIHIFLEDGQMLETIKRNLPFVSKEITMGLSEESYGRFLMEKKVPVIDSKLADVHQNLLKMLQEHPQEFEMGIFKELQCLMVLSRDDFKKHRDSQCLSEIVRSLYSTRKQLIRDMHFSPAVRRICVDLLPAQVTFTFGTKSVLGLVISICFLDAQEVLKEPHILCAVQKLVPRTQVLHGSFYSYQNPEENVCSLYLELEKIDGVPFEEEEISLLRNDLADELKNRVARLVPSLFIIRNEEEVMRNILLLSRELKYCSDLPQIMINFQEQLQSDLIFTVILVRALKKDSVSLNACLQRVGLKFVVDRTQGVGFLRRKHRKEATVFRIHLPISASLLRADSSVNLPQARQRVARLLSQALGEIRDYNGGMILTQAECFAQFKVLFADVYERHPELLENFFCAISPIEMQAILPLSSLSVLFNLFLEGAKVEIPKKQPCYLKALEDSGKIFVMVKTLEESLKEDLYNALTDFSPRMLTSTVVTFQGASILGYIYEGLEGRLLVEEIEGVIAAWVKKRESLKVLKLCQIDTPLSLDPRIGGDFDSVIVLATLFEGLTRIGKEGKPTLAMAESVEVSADLRHYTFKIRAAHWSNGDPVVAFDFEYAWKKILSPDFSTHFAYLFYPIKGAKAAKQGVFPLGDVGIRAVDEETLCVELEHPTPYFLELTANTLYSPVHHQVDQLRPYWALQDDPGYVCNGPFQLKKQQFSSGYELIKNPYYWDASKVDFDQILIRKTTEPLAHEMFKKDEVDWLGGASCQVEADSLQHFREKLEIQPALKVSWYAFNVQRFPFNHPKIRQALALALDRDEILHDFPYGELPAKTILPLEHTQCADIGIKADATRARALFQEGLQELGLSAAQFPTFSLAFTKGHMKEKRARLAQQQWEEVLGIHCKLETYEWSALFKKIATGDYQIGLMFWTSWVDDPIYTLNAFRYSGESINFSHWENKEYQRLLDAAEQEIDLQKRRSWLKAAEELLMEAMPVIPLFYEPSRSLKKDHLQFEYYAKTEQFDFKWASMINPEP
jgi:oligopeptide transport system substrate-binding protein